MRLLPPPQVPAGGRAVCLPVAVWEMRGLYLANICASISTGPDIPPGGHRPAAPRASSLEGGGGGGALWSPRGQMGGWRSGL